MKMVVLSCWFLFLVSNNEEFGVITVGSVSYAIFVT